VVSHKIKNSSYYDRPIDIRIVDAQTFEINYGAGEETYRFGQVISNDHFNFLIEKTPSFVLPEVAGKYYFTVNSKDALLNYLQQNVQVRPENFNARTIRISLADYNVNKARDLITAIDTLYLEYTKHAKNIALEQKIVFLNSQIIETESKLESFETYFEDFIIENRTVNLNNDLAVTINYLKQLDSTKLRMKMHLFNLEKIENRILQDDSILTYPVSLNLPPEFYQMSSELRMLKDERQEKLYTYNEKTYAIRQLDGRINELRLLLKDFIPEQKNDLKLGVREIEKRVDQLEQSFVKLPSMITSFEKNRRFYEMQEGYIMSLWRSKMDLEITRAGTVTNYVILEPASLPNSAIRPKPTMIYAAAFSIGLLLSIIFVLVRYLIHNKISTIRELERLTTTPILGAVPQYTTHKLPQTRLVIKPSSKSSISESLRTIRTNMEFLNGSKETKLVSVTSTIPGEGKTFIAVNLGAIIAFSAQKVCVVDLDMRKPKVHLAFGDEASEKGMSTLLIKKNTLDECIVKTSVEHLDYIPAGPNPPNPSELIIGDQFDEILEQLKAKYDIIILDTPPVGLVTDGVMIMKKSDLQLFVLRCDYSKPSFVKPIEKLGKINRFSGLTIIFNSVKPSSKGYGYGHDYGYGYYDDSKE
jgi:capsular exopolysaccharide synthesis family protein